MIRSLFAKIMGSYILIPLLILLTLVTILPTYLERYFFGEKEQELLNKGDIVISLIEGADRSNLNNLLLNLEKLLDTSILVFDQSGRTINRGRMMQEMMRGYNFNRGHHNMDYKHSEMMGKRGPHGHPIVVIEDEIDRILKGQKVSFKGETGAITEPIIGVGIPFNEGGVFFLSPLRGLEGTIDRVKKLTLSITLGAALLALFLGYFISRGISKPVKEMEKKVERMAKGDFSLRLDKLPKDEIGSLGESFNYMSEKLEENIRDLSKEKNRMKSMLRSMDEGVLGISDEGEIILSNPKIGEIFGLGEDFLGRGSDFSFSDELKVVVDNILSHQKVIRKEFDFGDKILMAQGAPIKEEGEFLGAIILVRDITEVRRLDRMRRLFVANVSHELKTPLTGIRGYLEAILDGVVQDKDLEKDYLGRALRESNRMSRLIKDILELARLQSGQFPFDFEEFDLVILIKELLINLEGSIGSRKVSLDSPNEFRIKSDSARIEEVLINLLGNAINFTGERGEIEIKVKAVADGVTVEVIDDGLGVPNDEITHIWERFHQVDPARRPDKEGSGLGLSIVKEIVKGLGGEVGVESKEGRGSRFYFTLKNNC